MRTICSWRFFLGLILISATAPSQAATLYVDNRHGDNRYDGTAERPLNTVAGPTRTISRALQSARPGDTIVIANHGIPYYESLQLVGGRFNGFEFAKFTLVGNGAVVSGARSIPFEGWRLVGDHLWRVAPWRKGHYQLIRDGELVPEHMFEETTPVPESEEAIGGIPPGHWIAWRGSIYYQAEPFEDPRLEAFAIAGESVGLTLSGVRHVHVIDLTFQHFRLDGVNLHNGCRQIILENVRGIENGRAGLAVGGTSDVLVVGGEFQHNRQDQLLITEFGRVELEEALLGAPPTVLEPVLDR